MHLQAFNNTLAKCQEYGEHKCCDEEKHALLIRKLEQFESQVVGCAGCQENMRQFKCLLWCGPDQGKYVTNVVVDDFSVVKKTAAKLHYSEGYCGTFFDSCKEARVVNEDNKKVKDLYGDSKTFCKAFVDTQAETGVLLTVEFEGGSSVADSLDGGEAAKSACSDGGRGGGGGRPAKAWEVTGTIFLILTFLGLFCCYGIYSSMTGKYFDVMGREAI